MDSYIFIFWRRLWCNGYRCMKVSWQPEFKSWTKLLAFHITLELSWRVCIQLLFVLLYSHLLIHAEIYIYICWIHTDTIIIKTHDDKVARINDARKEDAGRLLYKIFYLTSLFVSFERVVPSLRVRGSWGPNITEIFWPRSYGRQRGVFLVLHGCSTGALAFLTTSRLPPQLCSPVSTGSLNPTDRNSIVLCSIRRPYITFKLPRGDMDTPAQLLPISSDRDVSLPLSLEWPVWSSSSGNNCHPVQRSLSSGASIYESIMEFFSLRLISSANFRPRDFLS